MHIYHYNITINSQAVSLYLILLISKLIKMALSNIYPCNISSITPYVAKQ